MKRLILLLVGICLLVCPLVGCANGESAPEQMAVVVRGDLSVGVSVNGNLDMPHKTDLSFGTTGMVEEVLVKEGDEVVEGQVLARLDARSLELNVASAEAAYETAAINLMKTIYPAYTKTWGTDMPGVWLALDEAQENVDKVEQLLRDGKLEEVYPVLSSIEGNLSKAETKSLASPWELPWDIKLLELQLDQAQAALDQAKLDLERAMIVAPFDAVVADISVAEGKEVSSMTLADPAISLIDTSEMKMNGYIDEIDISMVKLGQEAQVIVDALPGKEVTGEVTFISQIGTVESGVVFYDTTVTLRNPDADLRDGMSATAELILESRANVLLLPNKAIQGSMNEPWVEVVTGDGQSETRRVTLGLSDGTYTEVLSGLMEGETVVVAGSSSQARGGGSMMLRGSK